MLHAGWTEVLQTCSRQIIHLSSHRSAVQAEIGSCSIRKHFFEISGSKSGLSNRNLTAKPAADREAICLSLKQLLNFLFSLKNDLLLPFNLSDSTETCSEKVALRELLTVKRHGIRMLEFGD